MHKKFSVSFFDSTYFFVQGSYAGCENYFKKQESARFSFHAFENVLSTHFNVIFLVLLCVYLTNCLEKLFYHT